MTRVVEFAVGRVDFRTGEVLDDPAWPPGARTARIIIDGCEQLELFGPAFLGLSPALAETLTTTFGPKEDHL